MHNPLASRPEFIFMLTRNDRTIADAETYLPDAVVAGVRHVGFKDVGLPLTALRRLAAAIRAAGATVYLETVSLDAASEAAAARAAAELGVDVLMGGTRPEIVLPIIAGTGIRYYPFAGQVVGHPGALHGTIDGIVDSARALLDQDGVNGIDLLAYRFAGDVRKLLDRVCRAAGPKPIVVAGSIDRAARIESVVEAGAAGFTVGTAVLDGLFPGPPHLSDQLAFVKSVLDQAPRAFFLDRTSAASGNDNPTQQTTIHAKVSL